MGVFWYPRFGLKSMDRFQNSAFIIHFCENHDSIKFQFWGCVSWVARFGLKSMERFQNSAFITHFVKTMNSMKFRFVGSVSQNLGFGLKCRDGPYFKCCLTNHCFKCLTTKSSTIHHHESHQGPTWEPTKYQSVKVSRRIILSPHNFVRAESQDWEED